MSDEIRIASFYRFVPLTGLEALKVRLLDAMERRSVFGSFIIAEEGFNSTIAGEMVNVDKFLSNAAEILGSGFDTKDAFHASIPFKRRKVKIKQEIVTLRKHVDISLGTGTHVSPERWNELLLDPETLVLDTRNDYEFKVGRFRGAVDPSTGSFSELPEYVDRELDPSVHKRVAMYCTGGIRCEKFAPYLKQVGFEEVFQLEGGILRYLEETPEHESLWEGECFVFDERVSVDEELSKGHSEDPSFFKNRCLDDR